MRETANKRVKGALGFNFTMRAVRKAMEAGFLTDDAKEKNAASFTNTIWSPVEGEGLHVTTGSGLPGLIPIVLDRDTVLKHLRGMKRAASEEGAAAAPETGGRKDLARLHHALRHEAAREKAANSEEMKAWTDRVSDISAGAACEMINDPDSELHGQRVCYCCRINLKKQKDKNATFAHRGGQQGFSELEAGEEEKQKDRLREERDKVARRQEKAEKKAEKASARAVFEDALKKQVAEMDAVLRLRGRAQRDVKIGRLQAALAAGEAAAKGIDGAFSQQKEALLAAKMLLQELQEEAKAEAKAAKEAAAKAAKAVKAAAELEKLRGETEQRQAARAKLKVRLGKAASMGQEKKDAEFDKLMKAMESLVKAELRQAALEAAL